ncbi:hypothetical protein C8Q79DRAFT_432541 [Trametes meyenii]|nr:hypothetical protein C8Q79DRAFT_432541 [Trametes meyenii]
MAWADSARATPSTAQTTPPAVQSRDLGRAPNRDSPANFLQSLPPLERRLALWVHSPRSLAQVQVIHASRVVPVRVSHRRPCAQTGRRALLRPTPGSPRLATRIARPSFWPDRDHPTLVPSRASLPAPNPSSPLAATPSYNSPSRLDGPQSVAPVSLRCCHAVLRQPPPTQTSPREKPVLHPPRPSRTQTPGRRHQED